MILGPGRPARHPAAVYLAGHGVTVTQVARIASVSVSLASAVLAGGRRDRRGVADAALKLLPQPARLGFFDVLPASRRYPADAAVTSARRSGVATSRLAAALAVHPRRLRPGRTVDAFEADRWAGVLGRHPTELWPDWA